MKKFGLLSSSAISSAALFGMSLAFAAPAYAQDDPAPAPASDQDQADDQGGQNVEVTGTRIRRPNIESNVPIVSVTADDLQSQGDVNIGDALNDLPSLRSTFSQANSTRFIGTAGISLLDLRGLGIERTLTLVNGRRHVTSLVGDFVVDVNTIPSDLLERVDVITGGSSSVYGSDAVAGVVNFVLRRDFDGIRLRGQGGISQQGDRGISFVSLTAGRNFADDRANIAINLEYVNAEALYFGDRPRLTGAFDGRCQYDIVDLTTLPAGEPAAGDGAPDRAFFCGVRNVAISNGGTLLANASTAQCQSAAFGPGGASAAIGAARCLNPGTFNGVPRIFRFNSGGSLIQDVPALDFRGLSGGVSGNYLPNANQDPSAVGATLRDTGQIAPGQDRYTANLLFRFDVTEAFRPFFEAKYVHVFARQEGQPSFFQGSFAGFFLGALAPNLNGVMCDNAYLTDAALAQAQAVGYCPNGRVVNLANPTTVANGNLPVGRFNVDFGGRSELVTRDTYRFVGGFNGDFNEDWNYEVSFNYGRFEVRQEQLNSLRLFDLNGNADGFILAADAVRNGAGQIVCRVNQVAVTRPDCVPIDVLGVGRASAAALAFSTTTALVEGRATQMNAVAYVNGDLSQLFELPGGPIRFVVGAEWRRETAYEVADPLSASGGTFFNAFSEFDPPSFKVLEGFGEIELPLLRDLPFAQELTVTAAARYSDYNTNANTTFAYNINGTWAPVRDLRFRANYSKSVRVPTLGDLFTPATQSFAFLADPCDIANRGAQGGQRDQNCDAQGIPDNFVNGPARTQTSEIQISGNPNLEEETSKSLTIGMVVTPRWIPGLTLTVDYYRIRINNLITGLAPQTVLNQCYDLPTFPNNFCALILPRNADFTFGQPAVLQSGVNFAQFQADGVDIEATYRRTFENGHRLNIRGIATYVIRRNNYTSPTDPNFQDRIREEFGDPQWAANLNISYGVGPWDLRWSMNYIGKQIMQGFAYETFNSVQGRPATNADALPANEIYLPDMLYHAARLNYRVNERFNFYMGIDNVFDSPPPRGLLGTGAGDPYDPIGRYFYAGATIDF